MTRSNITRLLFCRATAASVLGMLVVSLTAGSSNARAQRITHADSLFIEQIRNRISEDSRLPVSGITISAFNGAVRLRGMVATLAQKQWIEQIAYSVEGVGVVDNQLWVDTPRISDARLAGLIKSRLGSGADSAYQRVQVQVKNGEVKLRGEVKSWGQKRGAEEVISLVRGVRKLENGLKIRDDVNRTDEQIENAVNRELRDKIQMLVDYRIEARAVRGIVTLRGRVRSESDQRNAVRTALFVPGVVDVVDKIEVLPE